MHDAPLYPLRFEPVYQAYLWGGRRIPARFGRPDPGGVCAESWEVSDRPEGMSVVRDGPLQGATLAELVARYGARLTGTDAPPGRFPLLVKLIDAADNLSVQVHPHDENAARTGGEPKTEMWYMLPGSEGARYQAGFRPGVTEPAFLAALQDGSVPSLLQSHAAAPGSVAYIPGGTVHAIGAGCLVLEVQQNSNTTYRVYDWGRVDKDGRPRELHVDQARRVIRWDTPLPAPQPVRRESRPAGERLQLLETPYFRFSRLTLSGPWPLELSPRRPAILFVQEGAMEIDAGSRPAAAARGESLLLAPCLERATLRPLGRAEVLLVD